MAASKFISLFALLCYFGESKLSFTNTEVAQFHKEKNRSRQW